MVKKFLITIFVLFSTVLVFYIFLPNYSFPVPPPDALQSHEPADSETPLRRAYFTDFTRQQVLDWYENQMKHSSFLNLPMPTYLLNYPPEDAQTLIRIQTRSTFLEEIVHPFRESVYINGYEPAPDDQENAINIDGKHWRQKIIIKSVPSSLFLRLSVFAGIELSITILFIAYEATISELKKIKIKFW